jgi:hypothetical protein
MILKVSLYLVGMIYVQAFLLGNKGSDTDDPVAWFDKLYATKYGQDLVEHPEVLWLVFESIVFYSSIIAIVLLMAISKFREFTPLRDRVNLASYKKDKTDYLLYRVNDIHWFIILVQQIFLFIGIVTSKASFIDGALHSAGVTVNKYENLDFDILIGIRYALQAY